MPERAADGGGLVVAADRVVVAAYAALYGAYIAVVVVPVIVALLLAALLQPGAAALMRKNWPRSLAAFAMLLSDWRCRRDHHPGHRAVQRRLQRPRQPGQRRIGKVQVFIVRTFPITKGQLDAAVTHLQNLVDNKGTIATGALNTALTVGEWSPACS